jgi:hypothetical protein
MSKANATAASMAHAPEEKNMDVHASAYSYPGRKAPKAEKAKDAAHDQSALESGRKNSLGVSANGSHKGLPAMESHGGAPKAPKTQESQSASAARSKNSLGVSADGSHKGLPMMKKGM